MLTLLTVLVLAVLALLTGASVWYWTSHGGFFGWYMAGEAVKGFCWVGSILVELLCKIQNE